MMHADVVACGTANLAPVGIGAQLMAIIDCRECGAKVSTEAAACPNCGAPPLPRVTGKARKIASNVVKGLMILIGLALGFVALSGGLPGPAAVTYKESPCHYTGVENDLKTVVQASPLGQMLHLQVIKVSEITDDPQNRTCHAKILTNGGDQAYSFHIEERDGNPVILAQPE